MARLHDEDDEPGEDLGAMAGLERVARVARRLAEAETLDETLQLIVDLGQDYIDHCDGVTLMFVRSGKVSTPAFSNLEAMRSDQAQYTAGEGPCLSAMREQETMVIEDLSEEERWPAWREEISDLRWRSMIGLRLFIAEDTLGALNLYSREPHGFDTESQQLGQVFASHAAVAMKASINDQGLHEALETRDIIGQAKGVLMERERLSGQQAFERLRRLSNDHNVKLRELARRIVETGEVPD